MLKKPQSFLVYYMMLFPMGAVSSVYAAAEFFTIIGPDGRPLNIQREPVSSDKKQDKSVHTVTEKTRDEYSKAKTKQETEQKPAVHQIDQDASKSAAVPVKPPGKTVHLSKIASQSVNEKISDPVNQAQTAKKKWVNPEQQIALPLSSSQPVQPHRPESPKTSAYVTEIDGEQYVNNEYLEKKEFNLDEKKRFYMMPEGIVVDAQLGSVKMLPVEREKGVNKSFLDTVLKKNQPDEPEEVSALAVTYYRMPKEQVVESLDTTCFTGKKIKSAKKFDIDKEIGVWTRKPLKDRFDYEVVKLSAPLKQLKLTSYAATEHNPTFYWPFVVFLDQQGCILEGVSGYKNREHAATMLQHAALEGTIRLPEGTSYILMTPLASALDVQEKSLSNQGQIKLTAIR